MTQSVKRVLYVEGNVDGTIGGSYFSLFFLVTALDRQRFEPLVVFATDNALRARFHESGVQTIVRRTPPSFIGKTRITRLVGKAVNLLRGAVWEPLRIAHFLRRKKIDLLHLNNGVARNHSWMIAARISNTPCITHERGVNTALSALSRGLARQLHAVICISKAVHDNFHRLGLGDLKLVTIHNGLDAAQTQVTRSADEIRKELLVSGDARLVGMVGNIKPWKGQEIVISAVAKLRDRLPDVVCLLIGDTSPDAAQYRAKLEDLIVSNGLNGRVIMTGFRGDVSNYINALSIQIHASVAPEPFGRVLLEAMALGKPLLASNAGAVPEIVLHGETGLLFESGNVDELARGLALLLENAELASRLGRAGKARLEQCFSIARNAERTQTLYEHVLAKRLTTGAKVATP